MSETDSTEQQQVEKSEIKYETNKFSVKMPPFWTDKPEMWFCQVEAQFAISGVTVDM